MAGSAVPCCCTVPSVDILTDIAFIFSKTNLFCIVLLFEMLTWCWLFSTGLYNVVAIREAIPMPRIIWILQQHINPARLLQTSNVADFDEVSVSPQACMSLAFADSFPRAPPSKRRSR